MASPERPPNRTDATGDTASVETDAPARWLRYLVPILILALALRLYGLGWGLPNSLHFFSYHPDETTLLSGSSPSLGGINFAAGNFLPHSYNYGSLQYYIFNIALLCGTTYGYIAPVGGHGHIDTAALGRSYLTCRFVVAVMGAATVWAVFALGRRLFGAFAGLTGALLLAITPLHVLQSHYMTVDVAAALWLTLSLVFAAKLLPQKGRDNDSLTALGQMDSAPGEWSRWAAASGLFAGLSAATKYSGILVLFSLAAALLCRWRAGRIAPSRCAGLLAIGAATAAAAFLIAEPGSLIEHDLFVYGVHFESDHVMHHGEYGFMDTGPGWVYIVTRNLDSGMGLALLAVSLAAVGYAAVRRSSGDMVLAAFALPYYLLIGAAQSRYARYEIPLLPVLAVWTGRTVADAIRNADRGLLIRRAAQSAAAALALTTLADCVLMVRPLAQPDTRDLAGAWLAQHAASPTPIGFPTQPWFYTAPVNPYFSMPIPGIWRRGTPPEQQARYVYNPAQAVDTPLLRSALPPVVTVSEYEYDDGLRLRDPALLDYLAALRASYGPPLVFRAPHPLGGRSQIDGLPTQDLPHDMLYPSPTTLIFTRR